MKKISEDKRGKICLITGSSGLIGSECVEFFASRFEKVIGIDNNMRQYFFGENASTKWNTNRLLKATPNFENHAIDIREIEPIKALFSKHGDAK